VAGVQSPENLTLDGKSIIDASGQVLNNRSIAYNYYRPLWGSTIPDGLTSEFATDAKYKLYGDGRMYDITIDPNESNDLTSGVLTAAQQNAKDALQDELDRHAANQLIAPKFLNGYTRQMSDRDLDGEGDYRANTVLIAGDNNGNDQEYRVVAEFDLTDPNVADLLANFGSATLMSQVTLTLGNVPDIRIVALTTDENGDVQSGGNGSAGWNDFQAAGFEVALLTGLSEGDMIQVDVTDAVLADLGQNFTAFRIEGVGIDPVATPGADQIRLGGQVGEGIGLETATRLIIGALGDLDIDGRINDEDIDIISVAIETSATSAKFDLDRDAAAISTLDKDRLIHVILDTEYGDANLDGQVSVGDVGILAANFSSSMAGWAMGDFNGDGDVTVGDIGILANNYNNATSSQPIPEPTSLILLGLASWACLGRRQQRTATQGHE